MAPSNAAIYQSQASTPESLRALAGYLEVALDEGESMVLMRVGTHARSVRYIADRQAVVFTPMRSPAQELERQ